MSNSIKRAVVIGATGLVGLKLVNLLNNLSDCEYIRVIVRRENEAIKRLTKVEQMVVDDFLMLNDQDVDGFSHAFSCLGTTIKKAGSKQNFYNIDFEINAHFADLFEEKNTHFLLVSAHGADAKSIFFYNQVKGQLEDHLKQSSLEKVSIIRPSLLLGERAESRVLEDLSQSIFKRISHFTPKSFKYKPVTADQVAHTMVVVAQSQTEKFRIYDNLQIQNTKIEGF